jgi:glutaminyl-tRNA synthetase
MAVCLKSQIQRTFQKEKDFKINLNPDSLTVIKTAKLEQSLKDADVAKKYQFERTGYFCLDSADSKPGALVFNRIVELG